MMLSKMIVHLIATRVYKIAPKAETDDRIPELHTMTAHILGLKDLDLRLEEGDEPVIHTGTKRRLCGDDAPGI
jgi:hypothetical protein